MVIKASGSLSLGEIAAEYNGTTPHSISEYYGAPGMQSSGPISFSDFYNKSDLYEVTTSRTTTFQTSNNTTRQTSRATSRVTVYATSIFICVSENEGGGCTNGYNTFFNTSRVTTYTTFFNTTYTTFFNTSRTTSFTTLYSWSADNPT